MLYSSSHLRTHNLTPSPLPVEGGWFFKRDFTAVYVMSCFEGEQCCSLDVEVLFERTCQLVLGDTEKQGYRIFDAS